MGQNLIAEMQKRNVKKNIALYDGNCYVHKTYDPEMIDYLRLRTPDLEVLVHPECSPDVVEKADYVGSTSGIMQHVATSSKENFFILSECGLVSRLQTEMPQQKFIGSCTLCRYMKDNDLTQILKILNALEKETNVANQSIIKQHEVVLDDIIINKARHCIEKMFTLTEKKIENTNQ